jgi:hypothetical protein
VEQIATDGSVVCSYPSKIVAVTSGAVTAHALAYLKDEMGCVECGELLWRLTGSTCTEATAIVELDRSNGYRRVRPVVQLDQLMFDQLAVELDDISVTMQMAKNLEELIGLAGNSRSQSKVLGLAVRGRVGEELYDRLTTGWSQRMATSYFKLTRVASMAGKAVSAAQQAVSKKAAVAQSGVCKNCKKPAVPGNYGFCSEHRSKKQKV